MIRAGLSTGTCKLFRVVSAILCLLALCAAHTVQAQAGFITVQSTTSTENSGLFAYLLPIFTKMTGIEVRVVAVGTGQAIKNARNGDGDVLLVHARADEEKFVADGFGVKRHPLMYNDFVLAGPKSDPAGASGEDIAAAFKAISAKQAPFVSRGDDSGTHKAERAIWKSIGIDVKQASGTWYREAGQGMGATLNMATAMNGYVLSDRATWSAFNNRGELAILCQGDARLHNPYGVILVNPAKHPHVKANEGQVFIDWLVSPEGQTEIANFKINGEQQFFPSTSE